jgi:hypothetical protein
MLKVKNIGFPQIFRSNEWEWDISSYKPSKSDILTLQYKNRNSPFFSVYKCEIKPNELESVMSAFGEIRIHTDNTGKYLALKDKMNNYVYGSLLIKSGTPKTNILFDIENAGFTIGSISVNEMSAKHINGSNFPFNNGRHGFYILPCDDCQITIYISSFTSKGRLKIIDSNSYIKYCMINRTGKYQIKNVSLNDCPLKIMM